jgi:hypothetical protein
VQYDEQTSPTFTRDLRFGDIPTAIVNGIACKEFVLDINEPTGGTHRFLSIDQINIYTSATGGQTGLESTLGVLRYSLGATLDANVVTLDYSLNSGSGQGDMLMDVPVSNFAGVGNDSFVYLYSYFGHYGDNYRSEGGFEEWGVIPVPSTGSSALLVIAGLVVCGRRRR